MGSNRYDYETGFHLPGALVFALKHIVPTWQAVTPAPPRSAADFAPTKLEDQIACFEKNGMVCFPNCFSGEHLARLQRAWKRVQEPAKARWCAPNHASNARLNPACSRLTVVSLLRVSGTVLLQAGKQRPKGLADIIFRRAHCRIFFRGVAA